MADSSSSDGQSQELLGARVHYLRFTVHQSPSIPEPHVFLRDALWQFEWGESRGRSGYTTGARCAASGAELWWDQPGAEGEFCTLSLPGDSSAVVGVDYLMDVLHTAWQSGCRVVCNRIDLAVDTAEFTPADVWVHLQGGEARALSCRETWRWDTRPHQLAENGRVGCSSATLGSRSSDRYLRVYDLHGPTRVELECKGRWADAVWSHLIGGNRKGLQGVILDYLDFPKWGAWRSAFGSVMRLSLKAFKAVTELAASVLERKAAWVRENVSRTLSMVVLWKGPGELESLYRLGLSKLRPGDLELYRGLPLPA